MRSFVRFLMTLLFCLLIAGGGAAMVTAYKKMFPKTDAVVSEEVPPANVKVRVVRPETVRDIVLLTGRVEPWEQVLVSAETAGVIEWLGVEVGDTVKKGQEIARIDTARIQTIFDQAAARRNFAEQELKRVQNLQKNGIASPQDLDQTRTNFDLAEADLSAAKIQLEKSRIYAPIDGQISERLRREKEFIDNGAPLARIVQAHKVKVVVGVPERDINAFAAGDTVDMTMDAVPDRQFAGTIHMIPPAGDLYTRTFQTEIALDNGDGVLKPGMTSRVHLVKHTYPDAVAVPLFTILTLENQRFVMVEQDGAAHIRPVELGALQGTRVHVLKGLAPGDRQIVTGQRDLREGQRVSVTEEVAE